MSKADFVTSIFLLLFSLAIIALSLRMPRFESVGASPYSAPGIVPGLLGVVLALLSLILLIRSIIRSGYKLNLNVRVVRAYFQEASTKRFFLTLGLCLFYAVFLVGKISYFIATVLYIFVFIATFEWPKRDRQQVLKKAMPTAVAEAVFLSAAVSMAFRYLFLVKLP